jgi:hypothetical protein
MGNLKNNLEYGGKAESQFLADTGYNTTVMAALLRNKVKMLHVPTKPFKMEPSLDICKR